MITIIIYTVQLAIPALLLITNVIKAPAVSIAECCITASSTVAFVPSRTFPDAATVRENVTEELVIMYSRNE